MFYFNAKEMLSTRKMEIKMSCVLFATYYWDGHIKDEIGR